MLKCFREDSKYAEWCDGFITYISTSALSVSHLVTFPSPGSVFSHFFQCSSVVSWKTFLWPLSLFAQLFIISHTWGGGKPFYSHYGALLRLCCRIKAEWGSSLQASLLTTDLDLCMYVYILDCVCVYIYLIKKCVFFFYQPAPSAVVHVVIGHGGTWKLVAHRALCSSDGRGLSCSTAHFMFSISSHGWEAFFPPPVVWNNRDGKCLVYFLQKKDSIRQQGPLLLFWSRTRSLMWFPFVSDVFWLILSNQSPFVSW